MLTIDVEIHRKLVYFHRMGLLNDRFFREFPGVGTC
jgi:hypothetical protein